jgi:prepilin-type N-terminal cleavage/methylation domain-containing protein
MSLATALRSPRGSRRQSGFSLIEVLIALTLLGIALLLGMDLVLQNPRVVRRLDGERQAFRAMESTMEAVRAGVIPLKTCTPLRSCCDSLPPSESESCNMVTADIVPVPKDLTISMDFGAAGLAGLYQVTLTAQYSAVGHKYKKKLQTMVWAPPT